MVVGDAHVFPGFLTPEAKICRKESLPQQGIGEKKDLMHL